MRRRAAMLVLLALATHAGAAQVHAWNFRVLLDGRPIGEHRFSVEQDGAERKVRSEARFDVAFLFIDAFRYRHRAEERWRGDCLLELASRTEENGELKSVRATSEGSALVVARGAERNVLEGCQMTFAYWNPAILGAGRLLNAQTGELVPVRARTLGEETTSVRGRPLAARHDRLEGPGLAIDLWYAQGEWVALESSVAGGRRLRYELD